MNCWTTYLRRYRHCADALLRRPVAAEWPRLFRGTPAVNGDKVAGRGGVEIETGLYDREGEESFHVAIGRLDSIEATACGDWSCQARELVTRLEDGSDSPSGAQGISAGAD